MTLCLQESIGTDLNKRTLEVLMRAQSLKTNDMFDAAAAAELEQAFLTVCGGAMKADILNALMALFGAAPSAAPAPSSDGQPAGAKHAAVQSALFAGASAESIGALKKAIRSARHVPLLAAEQSIKSVLVAGEAILALYSSVKIGVLTKMQQCYDVAMASASAVNLEDDGSFSMQKKIARELVNVRKHMLGLKISTPVFATHGASSGQRGIHDSSSLNHQAASRASVVFVVSSVDSVNKASEERQPAGHTIIVEDLVSLLEVRHAVMHFFYNVLTVYHRALWRTFQSRRPPFHRRQRRESSSLLQSPRRRLARQRNT